MHDQNVRRIEETLRLELNKAIQRPCILCGDKSTNAHIWMPKPEHVARHGGSSDKLRVYCYGVCDRHDPNQMHLFESKEIIQKKIDAHIMQKLVGA